MPTVDVADLVIFTVLIHHSLQVPLLCTNLHDIGNTIAQCFKLLADCVTANVVVILWYHRLPRIFLSILFHRGRRGSGGGS